MQTNREDVGERHREVRLPLPPTRAWADAKSSVFRRYFQTLSDAKADFLNEIKGGEDEFIGSIYVNAAPEAVEAEQVEEGVADASVLTDEDTAPADADAEADVSDHEARAEVR